MRDNSPRSFVSLSWVLEKSSIVEIFESPRKVRALVASTDHNDYWADRFSLNPMREFDVSSIAAFLGVEPVQLQRVFAIFLPGWEKRRRKSFPASTYFLDGDIGFRLYNPEWDDEAEICESVNKLNGALFAHQTRMSGEVYLTLPEPRVYNQSVDGVDHFPTYWEFLAEANHSHEAFLAVDM